MDSRRYSGGVIAIGGCTNNNNNNNACGRGFGEISYGMSKVDKIMLKFRPIAPKPVAAGSDSSCSTVEHGDCGKRRRYVRANGNRKKRATNNTISKKQFSALRRGGRGRSTSTAGTTTVSGDTNTMLTLSLMPETPDRKENSQATSWPNENRNLSPVLLSFNNYQHTDHHADVISSLSPPETQKTLFVYSVVTLECVTETWITTSDGLGLTDQERVMNMEMGTCPSFITDTRDTVVWTNKAYREMITTGGGSDDTVLVVNKFNRVTMPPVAYPAFTCTVKVTWGAASPVTITAPCDVSLLGTGGYAWRLDVKAALCLGRLAGQYC